MTGLAGRNPALFGGAVIVVLVVGTALLSYVWLPFDPAMMDIPARLEAPSFSHLFGTDAYGRDVLSLVMAGARTALAVSVAATAIGMGIGVPLGLTAATQGGPADEFAMRVGDVIFAFPALLLAVLITAVSGPGAVAAIAAIGIFNIPVFARVTRGSALGLLTSDFVLAARSSGKGGALIAIEHVLPNLLGLLLVQAAIQISLAIIAEAGLSFVGLGVQPPVPSWGRMLQEAVTMMDLAPWLAIFPGVAILLTVLGFNLLGDGLRDRLDPRMARAGYRL
jgi:peptide/nickel transport system permease protein